MIRSRFQITQMTGELDDLSAALLSGVWTPVDTFVIRADQLTRDDHLCWSPQWTKVQFVVPFGSKLIQVSTRDYGMLTIPVGLMVVVTRG